ASAARGMAASLPSGGRGGVAAIIEPGASPLGFSCVATTKRSWLRIARATATRSLLVVVAWLIVGNVEKVGRELVDQLRHPDALLDGRIVCERQLRCPLQLELARDTRLQHAVGGLEPGERGAPLPFAAED